MWRRSVLSLGLAAVFMMGQTIGGTTGPDIPAAPSIPAFPGAWGWGAYSEGPRACPNPVIAFITNTNATGAGSFKAAWELDHCGVFVIPRTAGTVTFTGDVNRTRNGLYYAGHVAPRRGIQVRQFWPRVTNADDGIVRFLKSRPGSDPAWSGSTGCDAAPYCACTFDDASPAQTYRCNAETLATTGGHDSLSIGGKSKRWIVDHLSCQWYSDECVDTVTVGSDSPDEITVQNSLIGPGHMNEFQTDGNRGGSDFHTSLGALLAAGSTDARPARRYSWIRNIGINLYRDPKFSGADIQIYQNIIAAGGRFPIELDMVTSMLRADVVQNRIFKSTAMETAAIDACPDNADCGLDESFRRCNEHPDAPIVVRDSSSVNQLPPSVWLSGNAATDTVATSGGRLPCASCVGGSRNGLSCHTGSDCPDGGTCPAGTCAGGTHVNQRCTRDAHCPGSTCTAGSLVAIEAPGADFPAWDAADQTTQWNLVRVNTDYATTYAARRSAAMQPQPAWMPPSTDPTTLEAVIYPSVGASRPVTFDALDDDVLDKVSARTNQLVPPSGAFADFTHPTLDTDLGSLDTQLCPLVTDGSGPYAEGGTVSGTTALGDTNYADPDCDGLPSAWETAQGRDPNTFDSLVTITSGPWAGYLWLEKWLSERAGDPSP